MTVPAEHFGLGIDVDLDSSVVCVFGEVDILTAPSLAGALNGLIDHGHLPLVLDLGRLSFLDARGARVIGSAGSRVRGAGQTLVVRSASALTRRVLELTDASLDLVIDNDVRTSDPPPALSGATAAGSPSLVSRSPIELVDASLQLVTTVADATMTHASGVSITLERHGQPMTVAASSDSVVAVDHHQYQTGQGPCLDANTYGQWLSVESLAEETRWPAFVPLAMDEGIRSILSFPLKGTRSHGSLNLYATVERAFGEPELQLATLLAAGASRVLATADQHTTDDFA